MFEIEPKAQEIIALQSNRLNLAVMVALYPENRIAWTNLQPVVESMLGDIPGSTLSSVCSELRKTGLLNKTRSGMELTDHGRSSIEAFQEYRAVLLPEIITGRLKTAGINMDRITVYQEQMAHLPENYHPEPALLRIMGIHGEKKRMAILQSLSESDQILTFRELQRSVGETLMTNMPGSTLSNLTLEIEKEFLIEKTSSSGVTSITALGVKSLEAFKLYQDKLGWSTSEHIRQQLREDFGGLINL